MQKIIRSVYFLIISFGLFVPLASMGQTSWKGTYNTSWNEALNWTNGVPTSTSTVVIGDANFTGSFQPTVNMPAACRTLTITSGTVTQSKSLYVGGNLTISAGATLSQRAAPLTVAGNFINNGTYTAAVAGATVLMSGANQSITGTTAFSNLTILAGSTITISNNISVTTAFTVNGTFIPTENASPYVVSGTGTLNVGANGTLKVNAATFGANYSLSGAITLAAGSVVEYSATTLAQSVSATPTYATLRLSGSTVKTLSGNLNALNSTTAYAGRIDVQTGTTFDLSTFTANRGTTVAGGWLHVGNGATLRIGGTNTLPANFATTQLELNSTVEYYGAAQTVAAQTYGNLTLSTGGTKVTTATATTINGNLIISASSSAGLPAGRLAVGEQLATAKGQATGQSCVDCHGAEGNVPLDSSYPKIGGQYADYLAHALQAYRKGERDHALMTPQAANLSDQDIADLATYFGSRPAQIRDLHGAF